MSDVLLVQNTGIEGSGYLGDLLERDGFGILSVNAKHDAIPDGNHSLIIILGAPESANDDLPYLRAEQQLIRESVRRDVPVLGICLGSQLISRAFGGRVYPGPRKEIGFYDNLVPSGDPLFAGFDSPFDVFHWHGDTFDLPDGAIRIASSKIYPNQAFRYKSAVGLQFHLEIDEVMANLWLDNTESGLREIPYIDPDAIRSDIDTMVPVVKSNMEKFYKNFKSEFGL